MHPRFRHRINALDRTLGAAQDGGLDNGGGPPHDDGMEARVAKLEEFVTDARERLVKIETRLDQTASKHDVAVLSADVHKGITDIIKWLVGTAIVLGAAAITIMTFVLNNAVPKAPAAQQQPIIIQVPSAPAPATTTSPQK